MQIAQTQFDEKAFVANTRESFEAFLLEEYGPLMTLAQVAEVLGVSVESFRNTLFSSLDPAIRCLRAAKIRCGRRVRIPTAAVVEAFFAVDEGAINV